MSGLAFLSGMAQGVGEEYAKRGEEQRQAKIKNDQLLADSINKRLAEDDTLDLPSYTSLRQQEYKLRGLPDKDSQQLIQHETDLWNTVKKQKQAAGVPNQAPTPSPGLGQSYDAAITGPANAFNAPLPEAPQTHGQVKESLQEPVQTAQQGIQAQGVLSSGRATNQVAQEAIPSRVQGVVQGIKVGEAGGLDETQAALASGVYGKSGSSLISAKNVPGYVSGDDYIGHQDVDGNPVVAGQSYRATRNGLGQLVSFEKAPFQPKLGPWVSLPDGTYGQVQLGLDGNPVGVLTHDTEGNRITPKPEQVREATTQRLIANPVTGQLELHNITSSSKTGTAAPAEVLTPAKAPGTEKITPLSPLPQHPTATAAIPPSPAGKGKIGIPGSPGGILPDPGSTPKTTIAPSNDPMVNYLTGQVASGRLPINQIHGDGVHTTDKQERGAVQQNLAALGLDINKATTEQFNTAKFAQSVADKYPHILALIDQSEKDGKLGIFASRYNEFMSGTVGAGDPEFAALRTDLGLLQTALMKIHTGSRGSTTIMQKFGGLINGGRMDAETLKAAVNEAKVWIDNYAQLVPTGAEALNGTGVGGPGRGATPSTAVPGSGQQSVVDRLANKYR